MATSLISMLNRLPIYNRPKEPAIGIIGNPVLVETSNANLANLPSIPIQPKRDHFGNVIAAPSSPSLPPPNLKPNNSKRLPPLPGQSEPEFAVKYTPFRIPSPQASDAPVRKSSLPRASDGSGNSRTAFIQRKPAPAQAYQNDFPDYNPPRGLSGQSFDPRNSNIDDINWLTGKKKSSQGRSAPPVAPATSLSGTLRGLVKHQSIDDWVNKRQQTEQAPPPPLKVRGRTSPPETPQRRAASASGPPPKLAIRHSVFDPFGDSPTSRDDSGIPSEISMLGLNTPPPPPPQSRIPKPIESPSQFSRRYEPTSGDLLKSLSDSLNLKPDASEPPEPAPKDHITELEDARDKLISQRISINQEIYNLEQSLAVLPYSSPDRRELKAREEQRKQVLADIEKEIFDTGMLIHRAWRRRVREEGIEGPTHLWVHNAVAKE